MAIRRVRIDYTVYSPGYEPETGLCLDFVTFEGAKKRARGLGRGAVLARNFNQQNKNGNIDWWQDERCWYFDGKRFIKILPAPDVERWHINANHDLGCAHVVKRKG